MVSLVAVIQFCIIPLLIITMLAVKIMARVKLLEKKANAKNRVIGRKTVLQIRQPSSNSGMFVFACPCLNRPAIKPPLKKSHNLKGFAMHTTASTQAKL